MTQTATISGSLRDASGRPVANVPVEVLRRAYNQKGLNPQSSFSAETNDLGEYRIYGITPGRYSIAAGIPDSGTSSRFLEAYSFDDQVRNGQNAVHVDYAYIYYPGVTELKKASWIDIQPGSHHSDIDFTLTRQRLFNVHGKVTMSTTGRPPDHLNWSGASGGYDAMTGRFDLKGLLPGNYAFGLSWQSLHAFVTFVVTNSDVDLPAVTLMQPATLSGRIQVEGTLPPNFPFSRLYVRLQRSEMGDYEVSSTDVRADGTFDLGDIPVGSEYRVMIPALPSGFYLKTARLGGADALQNYVPITRSANLDIVISSSSGQIRGSVINNQLQPLAAAQVVLIPDKRDRTELFKPEFTDKNGRFIIAGVPPGDYKLFAWEDLARFAFFDPEILAQFEERGKAIHVEESSEQNIELKALPAGGAP
jgi:hypothetical protein